MTDGSQNGGDGSGAPPGASGGASFASQHPAMPRRKLNVAPTDGSTKFNTIRIPLIPVACWRLDDPGFDFDSSFVCPTFRGEVATLAGIVSANQGCPAAMFGHCDPAGDDALNKTLGDRRVIAVYALLTRQPALWEDLYSKPAVGDTWGTKAIQTMLAGVKGRKTDDQGTTVADPAQNPYYAGAIDGQYGPATVAAVKAFQNDSGNTADGQAGPATRPALFGAYMDWLCTPDTAAAAGSASTTPRPSLMQPTDFLGGASAGPGDLPKMSLQSCGKFNPVVLLTSATMNGADTAGRNEQDAPNRRVVMLFFPQRTSVDTAVWPCPKVKEAGDACKTAFWPDGDAHRKNGGTLKFYSKTKDTMACRFYDRFARRSPCEKVGWWARWDRATVQQGGQAYILLYGPMDDGDSVTFEVSQTGFGSIGTATGQSQGGLAKAPWKDWFHPDRVTQTVTLQAGAKFLAVLFTFKATAQTENKSVQSAAPLRYTDTLHVHAKYVVWKNFERDATERQYVVCTPWGTRSGTAVKVGTTDGCVVEADLPTGGASVIMGKSSLLSADPQGKLALADTSFPLGKGAAWRFCDVSTSGGKLQLDYRVLSATPDLSDPSAATDQTQDSGGKADVTFRIRRMLVIDLAQSSDTVVTLAGGVAAAVVDDQTVTPTTVASAPYVWKSQYTAVGGAGSIQIDVMSGGDVKWTDTFATGLPLNAP